MNDDKLHPGRWLLLDPKLDLYQEKREFSYNQYFAFLADGFVDVTDDPTHEKLFRLYKAQQ